MRKPTREELLTDALIAMRKLARVSYEGDPWYAEEAGIDVDEVFAQAKAALATEPA